MIKITCQELFTGNSCLVHTFSCCQLFKILFFNDLKNSSKTACPYFFDNTQSVFIPPKVFSFLNPLPNFRFLPIYNYLPNINALSPIRCINPRRILCEGLTVDEPAVHVVHLHA